jgi:hypothetical protein
MNGKEFVVRREKEWRGGGKTSKRSRTTNLI